MSGKRDEPDLRDILQAARAAPTEEARVKLLYAELRKLDPERAERLMRRWQTRHARRNGTVRSGDGGSRLWWALVAGAVALLLLLVWIAG